MAITRDQLTRLKERFRQQHALRWHMTLIMLATVCSGALATKLMLHLNVTHIVIRYPVAVLFSYLVFYACIKLWLIYITPGSTTCSTVFPDAMDLAIASSSSPVPAAPPLSALRGKGGTFSGAGATGNWGATLQGPRPSAMAVATIETSSDVGVIAADTTASATGDALGGASDVAGDIAGEAGGMVIAAIALLAIVLLAIFGVAGYAIYQAPVILTDAAFQGVMVASMGKRTKEVAHGEWMGCILRATWRQFFVVLGMTLMFSMLMHEFFPHATRLADIWK